MPAPLPGDLLPTPSGAIKPCDVNVDDMENHCYNWLRSRCKGHLSISCPGFIFHEDKRMYDQQPW